MSQELDGVKACTKCKQVLPIADFGWHKQNNRLQPACRRCNNAQARARHALDPERHRAYNREYYRLHKAAVYERTRQRLKDKEHVQKAMWTTSNDKRRGKLTPPDACSICGKRGPIEAHHDDYSKPREIRWLCRQCHMLLHSGELQWAI